MVRLLLNKRSSRKENILLTIKDYGKRLSTKWLDVPMPSQGSGAVPQGDFRSKTHKLTGNYDR